MVIAMRNVSSNGEPKRYTFPVPLIIRSDSAILITDGKGQLVHEGDVIIRSADTLSVELEPQEPIKKTTEDVQQDISVILGSHATIEPSLPEEYVFLTTSRAKTAAYGRKKSVYDYYIRERDMSFIAIVRRNGESRTINLGSLFKSDSVITIALEEFSREKPFYRTDIKPERMPAGLKQGQRIKASLDILTHQNFLDRTEVTIGKTGRKTERYVRTAKQLP